MDISDDFSKYVQLMRKAHETQIDAVRDEGEKWRQLYEKEHSVASSLKQEMNNLQQQLNVEVEKLKKLLNIANTKIAEKDKIIAEKDKLIVEKDRVLSQLTSESASVNEAMPNGLRHPQHDNGSTSPSLLEDVSPFTAKRTSGDNNVKWNKRKKRKRSKQSKRFKQITLTQHQSTRLSLSLRKNDRSINVIPQSPIIDLSTISSDEEEQDKPVSDDDTTDEYSSSNDFVNQSLINQDHGGAVNGYTTVSQDQGSQDSQNYDTASQSLENDGNMTSQEFIPLDQDHGPSQDNDLTTVHSFTRNGSITANHTNVLISQDSIYNLTRGVASQGHSISQGNSSVHGEANHNLTNRNQDLDYTFAPEVATNVEPHTMSQNSTDSQDQSQQHNNQREQSKSTSFKYVATVRKRSDRQKLDAAPCRECEEWYAGDPAMTKQTCRHRFVHPPVNTPADFWKIGFPDTPAE